MQMPADGTSRNPVEANAEAEDEFATVEMPTLTAEELAYIHNLQEAGLSYNASTRIGGARRVKA